MSGAAGAGHVFDGESFMAGLPFSPKQDGKSLMAGSRFSANTSRVVPRPEHGEAPGRTRGAAAHDTLSCLQLHGLGRGEMGTPQGSYAPP